MGVVVTVETCRGTKRNGEACRVSFGLSADGLCLQHDPLRAEQSRAARVAGGRATGKKRKTEKADTAAAAAAAEPVDVPAEPKTLDDAARFQAWIAHAVLARKIDSREARVASYAIANYKAVKEKLQWREELKKRDERLDRLEGRA